MKLPGATALAVLLAVALLVAGCGGSGSEESSSTTPAGGAAQEGGAGAGEGGAPKKATAPNAPAGSKVVACEVSGGGTMLLRATAIDCGTARTTMRHWQSSGACATSDSGSRSSCSLGGFRCQAVKVDRGVAVSCAKEGADVSFIAKG
ncbi:MAG: hypothetical protein JSS68_07715 [Actinobacteria bacterium]|nr:hypothetical protein [Actinomycetota bacterium]